jgi:hypothetical protein
MPKVRGNGHHGLREEVLNVKLAELLSRSGLLSVPETILSLEGGKRLPDVIIGDYWGVRVVLEGRVSDKANVLDTLERDCLKRIEEGIAAIVIGVMYPPDIRYSDWRELEDDLRKAILKLKVFSEGQSTDWMDSDLKGLSEILQRAYESLVREDTVNSAVDELRQAIEESSQDFSGAPGTARRLGDFLVTPYREEEEENDDE